MEKKDRILASFAEQESISLSQNIKWRVRKNYEQGKPHAHLKLYGYRWEGDERVIEPDEAEVVRFIFAEYLSGKSFREISTELDEKEINVSGTINNEGPYAFLRNGKVFLTYSVGSANRYTYALGLLTAESADDLLDLRFLQDHHRAAQQCLKPVIRFLPRGSAP